MLTVFSRGDIVKRTVGARRASSEPNQTASWSVLKVEPGTCADRNRRYRVIKIEQLKHEVVFQVSKVCIEIQRGFSGETAGQFVMWQYSKSHVSRVERVRQDTQFREEKQSVKGPICSKYS